MNVDEENDPHPVDKGKGRAEDPGPTESTPLLASQSFTSHDDVEASDNYRRRLWSTLLTIFLVALALCVIIALFLFLLAWSYGSKASSVSDEDFLTKALVIKGPDAVDVLNITEHGEIWVQLEGMVGLDAGSVIGVNSENSDGFWLDMWKSVGRWGVRRLDDVSVHLSTIEILAERSPDTFLASIDIPPLQIHLTADPPSDLSWLTKVSIPVLIKPTQNTTAWTEFARECWKKGYITATAAVAEVSVHGGSLQGGGWRSRLKVERSDISVPVRQKSELSISISFIFCFISDDRAVVSPLPGLPPPGRGVPFPELTNLVSLQSFQTISEANSLSIWAEASIVNPAPESISFTSPSLPFTVWLPTNTSSSSSAVPIASVTSLPFALTHPNITLNLQGNILPLSDTSSPALSNLLSHYLSAIPSPIIITTPLFPSLSVPMIFPAPHPKPNVLRNVTIRDMKIRPVGTAMLTSGTVHARVVLPKGMDVRVNVSRVLPDVLVFDGPVLAALPAAPLPKIGPRADLPIPTPLPDPLPEHAFAHIRPEDWLRASSATADPEEGEGSETLVSAHIVDVPLEVLPGREREFSNFVGKVIFGSQGALAGLQGVAAVTVRIEGLPTGDAGGDGEVAGMQLEGLPFQGLVRIGKRGL
ncbi:hypothetical protein EW146_g8352 [Bondarzewia mesenterica]|uniref:Uncharacterized protein n=1 Tax=Bondarzewia mesenterica TaxID=1095465 RepID=A0A4V3XDP1_9AGAM|nr:hypothetical protein EW146_g8352 [Bondarzewia mesenterica]